MDRLATRLLAAGHAGAIIVGSDSPTHPDRYLAEAVARLADGPADAVIGPTEGGGYYLLGLRRPAPALFQGIAWSTPLVFPQTLDRAARIGLSVHLLPPWFDVDTGADLDRLRSHVAAGPTPAEHTRALLQHGRTEARPRGPGGRPAH